jgi:peptide/nickel transport system substrate-binding protein
MALVCAVALAVPAVWATAEPRYAIVMHGAPRLPPDFLHLPYANPDAPKGGRLSLGDLGSFDSLNPFIIKGNAPSGLREYVYESLMTRNADEAFSLYGLIAESIDVSADRSVVTFHLRPEARFSDGEPITPEDVLFSLAILRDKGWPFHRSYYAKVRSAEKIGERDIRFTFDETGDREMPLIMGLMPILPRHRLTSASFERTTLEPPVGSGPYTVAEVQPGRSLTYRRNPNWWGNDLAINRGRYNFAEITVAYFRDSAALFEAFKSGQIDLRIEDDPGRWAEGYRFPAALDGRVLRREVETHLPSGMSALVFNTRRPVFADARVRRALILLFDAEWINYHLFDGLYQRTQSFFDRSELSSHGRPADTRERELLAPYKQYIKPEILAGTFAFPAGNKSAGDRTDLKAASELLKEVGFILKGEVLVSAETGTPLSFEFLAQTRAQERLMLSYARQLERLGIRVRIHQVDDAQYWSRLKTFDFDMIQWTWGASLSPGNEQMNRWMSDRADIEGSLNYAGAKSPAADAMIRAMLSASSAEEFTSAVRAFDRALLSGDYVIPLFHLPKVWVANWSHLKQPTAAPLSGIDHDSWWFERNGS